MVDECLPFHRSLDKLAETGETFSMEELAAKLVFDVIARIVFNFPLHAQSKGSQDLDDLREMISIAAGPNGYHHRLQPYCSDENVVAKTPGSRQASPIDKQQDLRTISTFTR